MAAAAGGNSQGDDDGQVSSAFEPSAPPLFLLAHDNGTGTGLDAPLEEQEQGVHKTQPQQHDPAAPEHDLEDRGELVDNSRAGVLLDRVDTPALACSTEHGAVPYLTRDLLLELQSRYPRSFGLLFVDMKTSLPIKDGAPDPGTLEERACNPAGRFITCLGARDPLGGVAANCTPAQVSVNTLYGRRSLTPAGHAALVARLRPTLVTAIMDEAPASASRTRQQKAVERSLAWLGHVLRATAALGEQQHHGNAAVAQSPAAATSAAGKGDGDDSPKENGPRQGKTQQQQVKKTQEEPKAERRPFVLGGVVGGVDLALRRQSARETVKLGGASAPSVAGSAMGGVSIGGLGMGEKPRERRAVLRTVAAELPKPLLRVCVGLSTPLEVLDAMLAGGVDVINSPFPSQLTLLGHALVFAPELEDGEAEEEEEKDEPPEPKRQRVEVSAAATTCEEKEEEEEVERSAILNLWDRRWRQDARPLVRGCPCLACRRHSRAYIHHLLLAHEMAGEVLLHAHNLEHCLRFFQEARRHVLAGTLLRYRAHIQRAGQGV